MWNDKFGHHINAVQDFGNHMRHDWLLVLPLAVLIVGCDSPGNPSSEPPSTPESTSEKANTMEDDWPFDSPENLAVITLDRIMDGTNPILYVTHDEDDGGWQFLDGGDVIEENAMVVSLRNVTDHDPTIKHLADLPLGWHAVRGAVGKPWRRTPITR